MRRRILGLTVGMTVLVVLAFAIPLAVLIYQSVENRALADARREAENLAFRISAEPTRTDVLQYLRDEGDEYAGQTWVELPGQVLVGQVPPAVAEQLGEHGPVYSGDEDGDGEREERVGEVSAADVTHVSGGSVTSIRAVTADGAATVHTFLTDAQLHEGLWSRWGLLAAASLGLVLLSFVGAELLARRLAAPLEETARTAGRLASGDTTARAPASGPAEVAQVGVALNELADRIDEVIAVEREAVADLSHRLRTPLTALKLDVDALADEEAAEAMRSHVGSLERTLTAVIHAARRPQREGRLPRCDASDIVRRRVQFWSALVEDQGRTLSLVVPDEAVLVRSAAEDLAAAVDALIENVIAHTPDGTDLAVELRPERGDHLAATLTVSDHGPGIPPGAGLRGRSDRGSTGLGLDIARRCAEASGGTLELGSNVPHGAVVTLRLGAA